MWIRSGSTNVAKDSLVKHLKGEQHKRAANLQTKSEIGAEAYQQNVVKVATIFQGIVKMKEKDRESIRIVSDYNNLLKLQIKNKVTGIKPQYESHNQAALFTNYIGGKIKKSVAKNVANARYFACLSDGSTGSSVTEQEIVYVLFLENAVPVVKYVSSL